MRGPLVSIATVLVGLGLWGAPSAAADPTPAVPSADQLTAQLQRAVNTRLPDGDRAGVLEGGVAAIPTANGIGDTMDRYSSMFNWNVQNPSLAGDQLNAELSVSIPMFGTKVTPIYFIPQDGAWKLSNASACAIAQNVTYTECSV